MEWPKFSGRRGELAQDYLDEIDTNIILSQLGNEALENRVRLAKFKAGLQKKARTWYETEVSPDIRSDWLRLRKTFLEKFPGVVETDDLTPLTEATNFARIPGEPLTEYLKRADRLHSKIKDTTYQRVLASRMLAMMVDGEDGQRVKERVEDRLAQQGKIVIGDRGCQVLSRDCSYSDVRDALAACLHSFGQSVPDEDDDSDEEDTQGARRERKWLDVIEKLGLTVTTLIDKSSAAASRTESRRDWEPDRARQSGQSGKPFYCDNCGGTGHGIWKCPKPEASDEERSRNRRARLERERLEKEKDKEKEKEVPQQQAKLVSAEPWYRRDTPEVKAILGEMEELASQAEEKQAVAALPGDDDVVMEEAPPSKLPDLRARPVKNPRKRRAEERLDSDNDYLKRMRDLPESELDKIIADLKKQLEEASKHAETEDKDTSSDNPDRYKKSTNDIGTGQAPQKQEHVAVSSETRNRIRAMSKYNVKPIDIGRILAETRWEVSLLQLLDAAPRLRADLNKMMSTDANLAKGRRKKIVVGAHINVDEESGDDASDISEDVALPAEASVRALSGPVWKSQALSQRDIPDLSVGYVAGYVNQVFSSRLMIDSGSTIDCISPQFAMKVAGPAGVRFMSTPCHVSLADDSKGHIDKFVIPAIVVGGVLCYSTAFLFGDACNYDMILSQVWLHRVQAVQDWARNTITVSGSDGYSEIVPVLKATSPPPPRIVEIEEEHDSSDSLSTLSDDSDGESEAESVTSAESLDQTDLAVQKLYKISEVTDLALKLHELSGKAKL
ncbi:hypothetical protein VTK73DRAFT_7257 [Phialemonium thermophilum]|uniref:CCHC-type domain-containing protein n=1 Tax=Phialemonium thermophilum TaxID=223376 RepID=A0ABR3XT55_9PEZI